MILSTKFYDLTERHVQPYATVCQKLFVKFQEQVTTVETVKCVQKL
jgi:hypothetical protein